MSGSPRADEIRRQARELAPWFHNLHLPAGVQTAPDHELGDYPAFKWEELSSAVPADLAGWSVLDVGCNAGFYAFETARRGASRVLGVDVDERYLRQARWARDRYGFDASRVSFRRAQVYEAASWGRRFDLVLFLGVFYHLRYPLLALDALARLTDRLLLFQSLLMPTPDGRPDTGDRALEDRDVFLEDGWPTMAFVEHKFADDPTNWWVPNRTCVEALLRSAGLELLDRPQPESYLCRPHPDPPRSVPREMLEEEFRAASGLASEG